MIDKVAHRNNFTTLDEYNEACPVGTHILYVNDTGEFASDVIRYPFTELYEGKIVAWFEGRAGCYDASRIAFKEEVWRNE